jgi:hypothetical protein
LLLKSLTLSGLARLCAAALGFALPGVSLLGSASLVTTTFSIMAFNTTAYASDTLEARKLPMRFTSHGKRWIAAVGVITSDTPKDFAEFAEEHDLKGMTVVLDSSGGSVLDAIKLGRQWRDIGLATTVGIVTESATAEESNADIFPGGYCESMCVFLLLSGTSRYVPEEAHIRVHQIWMGDRADDAKSASYTAQDVMIIERDVGRLAKYTFDMGGTGDLLALALSVPPWESLHELTASELRSSNLVTEDGVAQIVPGQAASGQVVAGQVVPAIASSGGKLIQDRLAAGTASSDEKQNVPGPSLAGQALPGPASMKSTKTAEAGAPTGAAPAQH